MAALEPGRAERTLKQAEKSLSDPDLGYYPEHQVILQRFGTYLRRLPQVRKEREAWDLAIAIGKRQAEVDRALAELKPAVAALKRRELLRAGMDRAKHNHVAVEHPLEAGKTHQTKSIVYPAYPFRHTQRFKVAHSYNAPAHTPPGI